jgi:hypothetical protein
MASGSGSLAGPWLGSDEKRERVLILRQLTHKIGTLPASLIAHLEELALEQLEILSVAWLDFQGMGDLEMWLRNNLGLAEMITK